jgi:hypothetical protein
MDTLTTQLTSSSAQYTNQLDALKNLQQQKINALSLKGQITERLMNPGRYAVIEYLNARQTYLNNKLDTDYPNGHYLEWRTPITHSDSLCAFASQNPFIRQDGTFANMDDWTSSVNYCKLSHWTLELWSTSTLSANDPDLPNYETILLNVKTFQGDYESFNVGNKQLDTAKISEAGLDSKYTMQSFIDYNTDWNVGMEWLNADTKLEYDAGTNLIVPAGINVQIENIEQQTTVMKEMTGFYHRRMDVSSRRTGDTGPILVID